MPASDSSSRRHPGVVRLALVGAALLLVLASVQANDYQLHVITIVLVNVMLAISLNWVMGYLGQLTLANAAVFGIGAYTAAILVSRWSVPFPVAILAAASAGSLFNALVALPALRLRGFFLAIATLTAGVFVHWMFVHGGDITAGASGLAIPKPNFAFIGLDASSGIFLTTLLGATGAIWWTSRLVASPFGRRSLCISEQELIAPTLGIDVVRHKVKVFLVSGAIAGTAGSLFAGLLGLVDPESFNFGQMIVQFMMVVLGGLGSILGSIVGAVVVTGLTEGLRAFKGLHEVALGSTLLAVILFARRGLYRLASSRWPSLAEARSGGSALGGYRSLDIAATASRQVASSLSTSAQSPALRVTQARKSFGGLVAIDSVSFEVDEGSVHGIIGPNGSGKSTMLNLVSGTTPLQAGRIELLGTDVSLMPAHRRAAIGVGRTFQNLQLVTGLTVLENVMLGADSGLARDDHHHRAMSFKIKEREAAARAFEALEFVGMAEFAFRMGNELSGGQMRLVEIARALATRPRLLLLDEPAAGLSLNRIDTVRDLILRINRDLRITVVLVEHVLNLVLEVSDRITVLNAGRVLASGTPQQVRTDASVQAAYLGRRASSRKAVTVDV